MTDIAIRTFAPQRLLAFVTRSPDIQFMGAWKGLHGALGAQGITTTTPSFLAVFEASALDGPQSMATYAAAVVAPDGKSGAAPLVELSVPGGRYATYLYVGGYEGMGQAWGGFTAALMAAGHPLALQRPCLERYLNDPAVTPPAELRTELCVPIADE